MGIVSPFAGASRKSRAAIWTLGVNWRIDVVARVDLGGGGGLVS